MSYRTALIALLAALLGVVIGGGRFAPADSPKDAGKEFARTTIDWGVVVGDVEKSVKFYTEAVGFKEVKGFAVSGDFCADAGLTDGKPLTIRVLVLGEGDTATKLKLMEVPGTKKGDNRYINSQLGYRYNTIYVTDMTRALARLKKAGVSPAGKGPVAIPETVARDMYLTVVHDPDGNTVELVGPMK